MLVELVACNAVVSNGNEARCVPLLDQNHIGHHLLFRNQTRNSQAQHLGVRFPSRVYLPEHEVGIACMIVFEPHRYVCKSAVSSAKPQARNIL